MPNLPISGLPNLTASTNSSFIPIVASGITYNINILDFWKSTKPFGTMYQDLIPDAPSAHTIGSIAYPLKSIYVSTGSVFIGTGNSLKIDNSGVLYSTSVFAAPTFQVGNITSEGGIVNTSGITFSVFGNDLYATSNSGGTQYNITQQLIPLGGTYKEVLTRNSSGTYGWGWSALTASQIPTRYYGTFISNSGQTNPVKDTIRTMSADTTEHSNGVILSANTKFVIQNAGVYNIQLSAQFSKTSNSGDLISIWFRKNGNDIPRSNTTISCIDAGGLKITLASWNYVETFNNNDFFQIMWSSPEVTMQLYYTGAQTAPIRPETPSLKVSVTQV